MHSLVCNRYANANATLARNNLNFLVYGHKAGSMTEANRRSLMNREISILRDLVTIAHPPPANISVFNLLHRRVINRKNSVYRIRYYGHISRRQSETLLQKAKNFQLLKNVVEDGHALHSIIHYCTICESFLTLMRMSGTMPCKKLLIWEDWHLYAWRSKWWSNERRADDILFWWRRVKSKLQWTGNLNWE